MKKLISLLILILGISTFSLSASLDDFFQNTIIEVEGGSSIKTQERGYWIGGGFRVKTPRTVINPVRITMPSIKAGCQGIDISFGAFDFINSFDDLIKFLGDTITSSTAIFLGGIQAVCPQCKEIITSLNTIANQLNQMQFDSCQLAQKFSGKILSKLVDKGTSDGTYSSYGDFAKKALDKTSDLLKAFINKVREQGCDVNNDDCVYSIFRTDSSGNFVYKSILHKALSNTYFKNDNDTLYFFRGIIGDYYLVKGNDGEFPYKFKYVPPYYKYDKVEAVKLLIFGDPSSTEFCNDALFLRGLDGSGSEVSLISFISPVCSDVEMHLSNIKDKFLNRLPLTDYEKDFLAEFRIPVYKVLNTLSIENGLLDAILPDMVGVLSAEMTYNILMSALSEVARSVKAISDELEKKDDEKKIDLPGVDEMLENIRDTIKAAYEVYVSELESWNDKIVKEEVYRKITRRIYGRMAQNPVIGAYVFSKGLVQF